MSRNGTDWWTKFYPQANSARPTCPLCDGCHSVNYNIQTKTVTEWNVGCEKCHGPGSEHVRRPSRANIVNPARLDFVHATDTCIQCHSQGQPLSNPISGQYYDWPVGFHQGLNLKEFFLLLSSTGLAYRRCELVRVNGSAMDIQFLKGKNKKKRPGPASPQEAMMGA